MVSSLSILFMGLAGILSVLLPIVLCIWFYKKKHADLLPFFIGCAVMVLFAFVLESLVHRGVLSSSTGTAILSSNWLYAIYGGFMAALFEETGRYIAFRTVLKKKMHRDANALMYGAGHGGIEALVVLGLASVNNIIYSVMINSGNTQLLTNGLPEEVRVQVEEATQLLVSTPAYQFLLGGVERIFAVILHISLSVLVWFAVKRKGTFFLFPVAFAIHFLVDAITVVLSRTDVPVLLIEVCVGIMSALAAFFAYTTWKKMTETRSTDEEEGDHDRTERDLHM